MVRGWSRPAWGAIGVVAVLGLGLPPGAVAQTRKMAQPAPSNEDTSPVIAQMFPPSATIGKETEVTLSGANLKSMDRLVVSGSGVEAVKIDAKSETSATVVLKVAADAAPGVREVRASGPGGLSNLVLLRADTLAQGVEAEPNDAPEKANEVAVGGAVGGRIKPQDLDHFKVKGTAGQRVTIDVEARRLGTSIVPVLTVMTKAGVAIAQSHETKGLGRDCRLTLVFPDSSDYVIQVRDNQYSGSEHAVYRLRLDSGPYATGMFPLGGPKGTPITVAIAGGSLTEPRSKTITLPDEPGARVDPGPFDGPGGPALAPDRLIVGDGPEVTEGAGDAPTIIPIGGTANGRLDKPGEVDKYTIPVKKGVPVLVHVRAAVLGSWLDSVVTLRDAKGKQLAENDDPGLDPNAFRGQFFFGNNQEFPADSRVEYTPLADGDVTVEVADRYGDGGPEYAYRLEVGQPHPDFNITLLVGGVQPQVVRPGARRPKPTPGSGGAYNLKPGANVPVNFLVQPEGRVGPIEVKAEGLPAGVTSNPVTIRTSALPKNARAIRATPASGGVLLLKVAPNAEAVSGEFRIVATAKSDSGTIIRRVATLAVPIQADPPQQPQFFGAQRPVTHEVTDLPIRVLGDPRSLVFGPPRPLNFALEDLTVPGPLLQGGQLDLALTMRPARLKANDVRIDAEAAGNGLLAQVQNPAPGSYGSGRLATARVLGLLPPRTLATVRITAAVDAEPGVRLAKVRIAPYGEEVVNREVALVVRPPIEVHVAPGPIALTPGGQAKVFVAVRREPGFAGPIDLRAERLPEGVKLVGNPRLTPGQDGMELTFEMAAGARAPAQSQAISVVGIARMPRGPVRVESPIRPMFAAAPADK
ncbi:MAG TPA: hypothetical protein VG406_24460 [Isosphaeraceae bacterium]|jgi:hypothetical protein|nr:hypothetical protein [Isosphaeraceae bacterium]